MIVWILLLSWIAATTIYVLTSYCLSMPKETDPDKKRLSISSPHYLQLPEQEQIIRLQGRLDEAESHYLKSLKEFEDSGTSRFVASLFCLVGIGHLIISFTHYSWWVYTLVFTSCLIPIVLFEKLINKSHIIETLFLDGAVFICADICDRNSKSILDLAQKMDTDPGFRYAEYFEIVTDFLNAKITLIGYYSKLLRIKNKAAGILYALVVFIFFVSFFMT